MGGNKASRQHSPLFTFSQPLKEHLFIGTYWLFFVPHLSDVALCPAETQELFRNTEESTGRFPLDESDKDDGDLPPCIFFCARLQPLDGHMKDRPCICGHQRTKIWKDVDAAVLGRAHKKHHVWTCNHLLFSSLLFGFHLHVFTSEFASSEASRFTESSASLQTSVSCQSPASVHVCSACEQMSSPGSPSRQLSFLPSIVIIILTTQHYWCSRHVLLQQRLREADVGFRRHFSVYRAIRDMCKYHKGI